MKIHLFLTTLVGLTALLAPRATAQPPDHVVVVILENKAYGRIIGNPEGPHINALAKAGASFAHAADDPAGTRSGSHALRHPSQPNYLELFSGDNQGVVQDGLPGTPAEPTSPGLPFNTPNLGANLLKAGHTFAIYSENLPSVGFNGEHATSNPALDQYERKHNPAVNWQSNDAPANNHLPPSINQPFRPLPGQPNTGFPIDDFNRLPTVSFVIPNEQHNMHDGSITMSDTWLKKNIIDTYLAWAQTHNSLLIVTFDEDNFDDPANPNPSQTNNLITTIFAGSMIKPGQYPETDLNISNPDVRPPDGFVTPTGTAMNHYNVLATIGDFYGLPRIGGSIDRPPITDVFRAATASGPLVVPNRLQKVEGETGNLLPLFSAQPIRYQQVYKSTQFGAAPQTINSIAFRAHSPGKPFSGSVPELQVNLSTTNKSADTLSSTFAANVGPDDKQVFNGPLQVAANNSSTPDTANPFDILISFSTPFEYDPAKGNLLVDVRNTQGGQETPPLDQRIDATFIQGDAVSRVYNYGNVDAANAGKSGGADENDSLGLVTQFGTELTPAPSPSPTPIPDTLFLNASARLVTGEGDKVMIGGFIIGGEGKKKVALRGIGPSLRTNGQALPGRLQNPVIDLRNSDGASLKTNDNWRDTQEAEIKQSGLAPKNDLESTILASLDPGRYTVLLSGKNGGTGVGLVEVYDAERASAPKLLNLSTRGQVQTGDNVMIAGLIIGGTDDTRVIFRGLGPSLDDETGTMGATLNNPALELHDANGQTLSANDNWRDSQEAEIEQSGFAPKNNRESAIIGSYPRGAYTIILRGKDGTTGIGLVEAYKLN